MSGYFGSPSVATLQSLRRARRTTLDAEIRKTLNLQIRELQQREARSRKSEQLRLKLGNMFFFPRSFLAAWFTGNRCREWITDLLATGLPSNHRHTADDFAGMLQKLLDGKPSPPRQPVLLTENAWTLSELTTGPPHWHK